MANLLVEATSALTALVFLAASVLYFVAPFSIVRHIGYRRTVDQETMLGALAAYLLIGMAFAFAYKVLGTVQAAPFFGANGDGTVGQDLFFSFVTLTTTGYGNLVPAANSGQSLAVLEALAGQLFLVTAVAKIVSAWRPRVWRESSNDADGESTSDRPACLTACLTACLSEPHPKRVMNATQRQWDGSTAHLELPSSRFAQRKEPYHDLSGIPEGIQLQQEALDGRRCARRSRRSPGVRRRAAAQLRDRFSDATVDEAARAAAHGDREAQVAAGEGRYHRGCPGMAEQLPDPAVLLGARFPRCRG